MMTATMSLKKSYQLPNMIMVGKSNPPTWTIGPVTRYDNADIKALFWKLHEYNSSLDPRFALSEEWESCFEKYLAELIKGTSAIGWLARDKYSGKAKGLLIAAIHCDSVLWRYREWVEVEALYVEKEWHGGGAAQDLMETACIWAREKGQSVVQLYVTASNERAIHFYHREDFKEIQVIMRRELDPE